MPLVPFSRKSTELYFIARTASQHLVILAQLLVARVTRVLWSEWARKTLMSGKAPDKFYVSHSDAME